MSATVIARRIRATPERLSSDAWQLITDLLVPNHDSDVLAEFNAIAGIGALCVENEALKGSPLVVRGAGPQVRVYCLYGDDAITGDQASETPLPSIPTVEEWQVSLPVLAEDMEWIVKDFAKKGIIRITVRDSTEPVAASDREEQTNQASSLRINEETFRRL